MFMTTNGNLHKFSGQSANTFKNLIGCVDKTPIEMMYSVLNSDRYQAIQI